MTSTAGYSGTPLAKKLGIAASSRVCALAAPAGYRALLAPLPAGVVFQRAVGPRTDIVHLFATRREALAKQLGSLRRKLDPTAVVWVSWPKKVSRVPTTITEDVIRDVALPLGFVDVKVCAIDVTWSGLKRVIRKANRPSVRRT